ncbi:MAG: ABC transporter ATP-binding protein [Deltaproteobacteria bacterium]|nr:ABC transporter ATP-binding protein [Deltaproteobacteria bacterium]
MAKNWAGSGGFVLTIPELSICQGEKVALVGNSGCGKSTVLDMLAMILRPDATATFTFSPEQGHPLDVAAAWRRKDLDSLAKARMLHLGYVLQTGGLFPFLSVGDNIGLSRRVLGLPVEKDVPDLAGRLGIGGHLDKLPGQLSVGERQRVAIARAMAHQPAVVIADEPTASLDPINAEAIMALFSSLTDEYGVTLIVATHDWEGVDKGGFRRVSFDLEQDAAQGTVRATVLG